MADRNENFIRQENEKGCPVVYPRSSGNDNNNRVVSSPIEITKKDDLYGRRGPNYSRSNSYQRETPTSIGSDQNYQEKGSLMYQTQTPDIISNEDQNISSRSTPVYQNNLVGRSNSVGHRIKRAPIVGWHNGSPTVFPSSPCKTPDTDYLDGIELQCGDTSSSKSSGICQDSGNTEDLSSLADERLLESTPALTINRSVESLTPDKDTFLTTTPDIGRSKDLSLGDELDDKIDLQSPGTDFTDDRILPTPTDSFLTSAHLTIGTNSVNKPNQDDHTISSNLPEKSSRILNQKNKIFPSKSSDQKSTNITTNPGYQTDDDVYQNSMDSDSVLDLADFSAKEEREKPKVPDGGWGWVVVLSSLVISMIADGVSFSFGLLYIEFLHEFGASKAKTAWIGSLFMAVPLLSGPVMSALVDRYGCRSMTIVGGLVSGLGFVLSSFSNSIEVMYLTFGVIAGLGLGLCYVTAVVSIAFWFDKKRTLAVGLGACGTGIGTFVYAPMTTYFIQEYGWRGTCLLLAGTFFNMIVCGAVMRDPEWWIEEQKKQNAVSPKKSTARSEGEGSAGSPVDEFPGVEEIRKLLKSGQTPEYLLQNLSTSTEAPNCKKGGNAFRSVVNLPTYVKQSEKVPLEVLELLSTNSRLYNVILENYPNLLLCRSLSDKNLDKKSEDSGGETGNKSGVTMSMRLKKAKDKSRGNHEKEASPDSDTSVKILSGRKYSKKEMDETNPLLAKENPEPIYEKRRSMSKHHIPGLNGNVVRTDSLPWLRRQFNTNTHYFKDIRVHRNSVMYRGAALNLNKYRLRASSCPNIYRNSMTTLAKENEEKWYTELIDLIKGMFDFSMFLEFHFLLLSLSTILLFTWFIVPYFYLAEHLTRNDYSESHAAKLLSIIGITNTIGMIGLGWAGDQPWMNVSKTYAWCLAACGVATILMSIFTKHYSLLMVTSAAFGLFFASSFSFTPVILVELIPLERFTTAYGLCLLCQGIGNLLGPPLAGWLFDITGSWELSFLQAGGWIIFSGVLIAVIPYTRNRRIWGSGPIEMERDRECLA